MCRQKTIEGQASQNKLYKNITPYNEQYHFI
jgi:hypothetical protein